MKTKIISIISGAFLMAVPGTFALNTGVIMSDEPYVDDIPFNTVQIAESCRLQAAFYLPDGTERMKDEAYINDIPFDTKKIAEAYLAVAKNRKEGMNLPEEAYVNDIPFSTVSIAENSQAKEKDPDILAGKDQRIIKIRVRKLNPKKDQYIIDLVSGKQLIRDYSGSSAGPEVVKVLLLN